MQNKSRFFSQTTFLVLLISALTLIPFLGLTNFNTKGEPREAVVALSMLQEGNWVLPQNNGGEVAYKPPFFHWAVAATSWLAGGISEFTCRLPSALATVVLVVCTFLFFRRRSNESTALLTALSLLTCFEVHRSATLCRVDMVLTMFIVLVIYQLKRWTERGLHTIPFFAILFMSGGVLTKGPVAILLPCLVSFVYIVWNRAREKEVAAQDSWPKFLLILCGRFFLIALASLIIPSLWYYAAYLQGGDKYLYLVYEENVLRFIGKMPYGSHENGPHYYFVLLLAGLLPFTLLVVLSFFGRRLFRILPEREDAKPSLMSRLRKWHASLNKTDQAALTVTIFIILFYTIPKSKRSVYILPVYPFIAYFIARFFHWLEENKPQVLHWFRNVLVALIVLGFIVYFVVAAGWIPLSLLGAEDSSARLMVKALQENVPPEWTFLLVFLVCIYLFYALRRLRHPVGDIFYSIIALYLLLDVFVLPPVLNSKSDKPVAAELRTETNAPIYTYLSDPSKMMHFFTLNFYLDNALLPFPEDQASERFNTVRQPLPDSGLLLVGEKDADVFLYEHPQFTLSLTKDFHHRSCDNRQNLQLYRFARK